MAPIYYIWIRTLCLCTHKERASEVNGVLTNNRLAHAELLGKMEKEDFAFAVGLRRCVATGRCNAIFLS